MTIASDIQKLDAGAEVVLWEIDATALGGTITRLHDGKNELKGDVVWNGNTYQAWPIKAEGFEKSGEGTLARPRIRLGNVNGLFYSLNEQYQDMIGAKVTRIKTLAKYLDAANFSSGNPDADPSQKMTDQIYRVFRKTSERKDTVEYELVAPWDVQGLKLPRRIVAPNICPWVYRSSECGYAGGAVAKKDDTTTSDPNLDDCGKRVVSCQLRFGTTSDLPFGGFPGAGLVR